MEENNTIVEYGSPVEAKINLCVNMLMSCHSPRALFYSFAAQGNRIGA